MDTSDSLGDRTQSCAYTFDPDTWEAEHDRDSQLCADEDLTNGVWECPHTPEADHDYCLFHLSPSERPADADVSRRLLDILSTIREISPRRDRRRFRQFIGATLPELSLDAAVIDADDNYPLDFRHAEIGSFSCVNGTLTHDLWFDGARISEQLVLSGKIGRLQLSDGELTGARLDVSGSTFDSIELTDTTMRELIADDIRTDHGTFDDLEMTTLSCSSGQFVKLDVHRLRAESADFRFINVRMANFNELNLGVGNFYFADINEADFRRSTIDRAVLKEVEFSGGYFNDITFSVANFIGATIERGHFTGATIGEGSFHDCTISSKINFTNGHLGWVNFQNATVSQGIFRDCTLEQVTFRGTTFETANFERVDCAGALNLGDIQIDEEMIVEPVNTYPPADTYVSLRRSKLGSATISQPRDGTAIYDLEDTTLGDVQFLDPSDDGTLLDRLRFLRTQFDNFDFRDNDDIDPWKTEFVIHELGDIEPTELDSLLSYGSRLFSLRLNEIDGPTQQLSGPQTDDPQNRVEPRQGEKAYAKLRQACDELSTDHQASSTDHFIDLTFSPQELETTYLRAKNGANQTHDNDSASEFFQKEMRQRRYRYRQQIAAAIFGTELGPESTDTQESQPLNSVRNRAKQVGRNSINWLSNATLAVTSSYGEKPSYVVMSSLVIVLLFGTAYTVAFPSLFERTREYFILSFGAFVSFLIGPTADVDNSTIGFLTQIEGFVGAFFIALFVFTLTRSVHR